MRTSSVNRNTSETTVSLCFSLDGTGECSVMSGVGFLDHMLTLFTRHGHFNLDLRCEGDTCVDAHHSTEDIGICLGRAIREALGNKRGIRRYGNTTLPMDEALILCAIDISGRSGFYPELQIPAQKVGDFDTELCSEFFLALAREAGITIHLRQLAGQNSHHIIEGCFKAFGMALREAVTLEGEEIPSTKGVLE